MRRLMLLCVPLALAVACDLFPVGPSCGDGTCGVEEPLRSGEDWLVFDDRCTDADDGPCMGEVMVRLEGDYLVLDIVAPDGSHRRAAYLYDEVDSRVE